jgi:hypothetical protein
VIVALLLVCTTVVHAGPHQVLVLKAEGNADAATRANVEPHVLRLAKLIDGAVDQGDITLSDAAAAAGCNAADSSCKNEILATFAVDEIVATTVSLAPLGQVTVTVRRLQKGAAPRAAATTLAPNKAQPKLDQDIGPLFGAGLSTGPLTDRNPASTTTVLANPTTGPTAPPAQDSSQPVNPYDDSARPSPPASMGATDAPPNRGWQKVGIGVGASLVLLSVIMWTQASGKQEEIDNAPHDTPADFQRLRDLEEDADGLAGSGNLFFLAGVVLGGVSGYYYWKKGRAARTQSARITPTILPGGAGVVLSYGGDL